MTSSASHKDLLQTSLHSPSWQITGFVLNIHACTINKQTAFAWHLDSDEPKNNNEFLWAFWSQNYSHAKSAYKRLSAELLNQQPSTWLPFSVHPWMNWQLHWAVVCSIGLDHEPRSAGDKLETKRPTTYGAGAYGITQLTRWLRDLLICKMFQWSTDTECDAWRGAASFKHPQPY